MELSIAEPFEQKSEISPLAIADMQTLRDKPETRSTWVNLLHTHTHITYTYNYVHKGMYGPGIQFVGSLSMPHSYLIGLATRKATERDQNLAILEFI